jgi:hypothetical protein
VIITPVSQWIFGLPASKIPHKEKSAFMLLQILFVWFFFKVHTICSQTSITSTFDICYLLWLVSKMSPTGHVLISQLPADGLQECNWIMRTLMGS